MVTNLNIMLYDNNVHAKAFKMAMDMLKDNPYQDLKLKLIYDQPEDNCVYNQPTVSEVAILIIGNIDSTSQRYIII